MGKKGEQGVIMTSASKVIDVRISDEETLKKFLAIKELFGLRSDAETVRIAISLAYRCLWRDKNG